MQFGLYCSLLVQWSMGTQHSGCTQLCSPTLSLLTFPSGSSNLSTTIRSGLRRGTCTPVYQIVRYHTTPTHKETCLKALYTGLKSVPDIASSVEWLGCSACAVSPMKRGSEAKQSNNCKPTDCFKNLRRTLYCTLPI